jgi:hypothetical protein
VWDDKTGLPIINTSELPDGSAISFHFVSIVEIKKLIAEGHMRKGKIISGTLEYYVVLKVRL